MVPGKKRILLVEDNEDTLYLVTQLLASIFEVIPAVNYADGLELALKIPFDLILLDVRLPDGDGLDLCRQIRAYGQQTPVVFCSANAYGADKQAGVDAGGQAYITKPYHPDVLLETVKRVIVENEQTGS